MIEVHVIRPDAQEALCGLAMEDSHNYAIEAAPDAPLPNLPHPYPQDGDLAEWCGPCRRRHNGQDRQEIRNRVTLLSELQMSYAVEALTLAPDDSKEADERRAVLRVRAQATGETLRGALHTLLP